jgi:hypothetical protein
MIHRRVLKPEAPIGFGGRPLAGYSADAAGNLAAIQGFRDTSADPRDGLRSMFAYGKRSAERAAYQQAHTTPSGVPGVLNLIVARPDGTPIPFAPFEWNGRQMYTDAKGMIKYVEKDYFQSTISMENERIKYVTQLISLVAGQPSENVIALFGYEFWSALPSSGADNAVKLYEAYLNNTGLNEQIKRAKRELFVRYAGGECSPEVMCNFGDNDPEWSKAFNKLSLLLEYHPSAILFDQGTLNPLESSGVIHGDKGANNMGSMKDQARVHAEAVNKNSQGNMQPYYPDAHASEISAQLATAGMEQ